VVSHLHAASLGGRDMPGCNFAPVLASRPASALHPKAPWLRPGISIPQVHLRILHPGNLRPNSAPQKIRQTVLAGHSLPLVQISMQWVQIIVVKLYPGTSRPPSDAACKCETAQHYIFNCFFLNKRLSKHINPVWLYLEHFIYPTKPSAAFPNLVRLFL
jgi:hypothetical protein